jgi:hypothetical protein
VARGHQSSANRESVNTWARHFFGKTRSSLSYFRGGTYDSGLFGAWDLEIGD